MRVEKDAADPTIRYVYGKVTDGSVDTDEQIVDPVFARKALAEWYDTGANVRQMHATTLPPAGKGVLLEHHEGDGEWVRTKVVEPVAVKLVDEGVYTGYSVGISRPRIERSMKARNGIINGGKIVEISLVDRPALPAAKFAILKAAGPRGKLEFVGKVVLLDEPETVAKMPKPLSFDGLRLGQTVVILHTLAARMGEFSIQAGVPGVVAEIVQLIGQTVVILHELAGRMNGFVGHMDLTRQNIRGGRLLATGLQEEVEMFTAESRGMSVTGHPTLTRQNIRGCRELAIDLQEEIELRRGPQG